MTAVREPWLGVCLVAERAVLVICYCEAMEASDDESMRLARAQLHHRHCAAGIVSPLIALAEA